MHVQYIRKHANTYIHKNIGRTNNCLRQPQGALILQKQQHYNKIMLNKRKP